MEQLIHALDGAKLGLGVKRGLLVKAGTGLSVDVAAGIGFLRTLQDDDSITNKAAYGLNQPGKLVETAGGNVAIPASSTKLVWLKTDGTFVVTNDTATGDYTDVAPELAPDPYRGAVISGLQKSYLRQQQIASLPLAKVTTDGDSVTAVDNTIAPLL